MAGCAARTRRRVSGLGSANRSCSCPNCSSQGHRFSVSDFHQTYHRSFSHALSNLNSSTSGQQLKVRFGEWDASSATEPIQAQEFIVSRIFTHPQYVAASLRNDIAILRLATAVPLGQTPTIGTVCLPANQLSGMRCWVAGERIVRDNSKRML